MTIAFTAPHHQATETGLSILKQGGNAVEAMVAAAAEIAVQYPHMNSLGGDGFWIISKQGQAPIVIDGSGRSASDLSAFHNLTQRPTRGGLAALTMAGTLSGWQQALQHVDQNLPLSALFERPILHAKTGVTVTQSLENASRLTFPELHKNKAFASQYLNNGESLNTGHVLRNGALGDFLAHLADYGLDDFYQGETAQIAANSLQKEGSPLQLDDFNHHQATIEKPLSTTTQQGTFYNTGAPTQGLASLLILAIYDRLAKEAKSSVDHTHLIVEATKQAFIIRDQHICDPSLLKQPLASFLSPDSIDDLTNRIDPLKAAPWPHQPIPGDTIWMGCQDSEGTMVSFIQSIYWEFGSGVVIPELGVVWNNRGTSFNANPEHHNALQPNKKPLHTLNPAYAELNDGRRMVYGTMGGEGQPQTQACIISRFLYQDIPLGNAVSTPRWLLGKTWGDNTTNLRIERSLYDQQSTELEGRGHVTQPVTDNNELMGHAGAIVSDNNGHIEAATDPRSDGRASVITAS